MCFLMSEYIYYTLFILCFWTILNVFSAEELDPWIKSLQGSMILLFKICIFPRPKWFHENWHAQLIWWYMFLVASMSETYLRMKGLPKYYFQSQFPYVLRSVYKDIYLDFWFWDTSTTALHCARINCCVCSFVQGISKIFDSLAIKNMWEWDLLDFRIREIVSMPLH